MSNLGLTNFGDLTAPIQPMADFDNILGEKNSATQGSGLIGYSSANAYQAGSAGFALNAINTAISGFVTSAALSASNGSSLVGFSQSGTGAVTQTSQSKMRLEVNIEDFGGSGDNSTDNLSAWNKVAAAFPNACVIFSSGTYLFSGVAVKPVGMSIRGKGRGVTRLKMANGANAAAVIQTSGFATLTGTTSTGGEFNSEIRDLTIDGNKSNNTAGLGIQLYGKYFNIENVDVESCIGNGIYTEYGGADNFSTPAGTLEATISTVYVQQCNATGIFLKGPHDMTLQHVTSWSNSGWGIEVLTAIHVIDVNTYLNSSGGAHVYSSGGYIGSMYGTAFVGSTATGIGCYLQSGGNVLSASLFGGPIALQADANNNIVQGEVANSTSFGLLLNGANAQGIFDLTMFNNTGTIFGVSTTVLNSQVRAFIGDTLGTLQNGAFKGNWHINGYTGFLGAATQIGGYLTVQNGKICPPNADANFSQQSTVGVFYSSAVPTAGTYVRGDRVFNNTPSIGSPKGWICTVSGTPGTWVSEGNL